MRIDTAGHKQERRSLAWRWLDRGLLLAMAAYGVVVLLGLLLAARFVIPAEDAVILFQYSQNLAHHGAITYFAGGPHAEGATDFAWMVLIAGAIKAGMAPYVFVAMANFCSLLLLGVTLLRLGRLRVTTLRVLAIAGAAGMVSQVMAAVSGFAVLPDALLLVLLLCAVERQRARSAALLALVLCLFRPDGVVFAMPLLAALLVVSGMAREERVRRAGAIGLYFVLPGIVYFVWRAHYFGELFPLPFLVKADTHRLLGLVVVRSVAVSMKYMLFDAVVLLPLVLLPLNLRRPLGWFRRSVLFGVLLVPTLFYWAMRLDQNIGDRFFFYLPLAAAVFLVISWKEITLSQRRLAAYSGLVAWVALLLFPLLREVRSFRDFQFREVQQIAQDLGRLPGRGSLLTTEAGWLAYESGWVVYDAWGLNTRRFAEHPIVASDVVSLRPDLIALHPERTESCLPIEGRVSAARSWIDMDRSLIMGAHAMGDYELWLLANGSTYYRNRKHWKDGEEDRECFLVRKDSPLAEGMREAFERHGAIGPPQSDDNERLRLAGGHP